MKATHKIVEGKTNRQLANEALKAMSLICEADCGTIRNHYEIASYVMPDGRTILETIYQDGFIRFNNGWFIVEVDDYSLYVDVTEQYIKEFGIGEYEIIDTVTVCE